MGKNEHSVFHIARKFVWISSICFESMILEKCSHVRAHHLFLESLNNPFPAIQCESYEEVYKRNQCTCNDVVALMGGDITPYTPKAYGIVLNSTNL